MLSLFARAVHSLHQMHWRWHGDVFADAGDNAITNKRGKIDDEDERGIIQFVKSEEALFIIHPNK